MNKRLSVLVALTITITLVLMLLYIKSMAYDVDKHTSISKQIDRLIQANNKLNEDLAHIRAGKINHYAHLTQSQYALPELFQQLQNNQDYRTVFGSNNTNNIIGKLQVEINTKIKHIEAFKQKRALLKNSLHYFPKISHEILGLSLHDDPLAAALDNTSHQLMYFSMTGDEKWRTQALAGAAVLDTKINQHQTLSKTQRMQLANYLDHSDIILQYSAQLLLLNAQIDSDLIASFINLLNVSYMDYNLRQTNKSEVYRLLMFITSMILILYICYILFLLARSAYTIAIEKEKAQVTLESIGNGVIVTDAGGLIEYLNPAAARLIGTDANAATGKPLADNVMLLDETSMQPVTNSAQQCITKGRAQKTGKQAILVSRDNKQIYVEHSAMPIRGSKGNLNGAVMVINDVTRARLMARKLEWQATHDPLTGLINRREFENRLTEAWIMANQDGRPHTLMMLDLDQFKIVNDSCGHAAGDELLIRVTGIISGILRASDVFARLGGDEFAILLNYCDLNKAESLANNILNAIKDYSFIWDDQTFYIGVSIGVVPVTGKSADINELLSAADMACYTAKNTGRNRVYITESNEVALARRKNEILWVNRLNEAILENRFLLYFQQIVPLKNDDMTSTQDYYYETLIRLREKDDSIVLPDQFLPAAERYKLMPTIDRWVIRNTLQNFAQIRENFPRLTLLNINLSGSSVSDKNLADFITEQLTLHQVDAKLICFEITETEVIANLDQARSMITTLRDKGCRFALDDFGAGMSSYHHLKSLPVDFIKIDGKFIQQISADKVSHVIIEMINQVAHVMGIKTIAENVEDEATLHILNNIGIDYAQGILIDRPAPLNHNIIKSSRNRQ